MRLVSEHSLYDDLELYSHVGNCVRVQGSGRTRDKESEFKRHNHWEPGREERGVPASQGDEVQKQRRRSCKMISKGSH